MNNEGDANNNSLNTIQKNQSQKQISLKEEQVDELLEEIEGLDREFTKLSYELSTIKETSLNKIEEKNKLTKLEEKYEMIKRDKHRKLEFIRNVLFSNSANQNSINKGIILDFQIDKEELVKCIPSTPLNGLNSIASSLKEFENILKNNTEENNEQNDKHEKENPFVTLSYLGEKILFYFPEDYQYTLNNLLIDAVDFFISKKEGEKVEYTNYVFTNELSSILALNVPVIEMYKTNKNVVFVLSDKKNVKIIKKKKNDEGKTTLTYSALKFKKEHEKIEVKLNNFLSKYKSQIIDKKRNAKTQNNNKNIDILNSFNSIDTENNTYLKEENIKKRIHEKAVKKGEIMVKIERTIGKSLLYIIFYLFFIVFSFNFIINKKGFEYSLKLNKVILNEFFSKQFKIQKVITDFFNETSEALEDNTYSISLDLTEVNQLPLLEHWINQIFFPNVGFNSNTFDFLIKYKLVGPVRFTQKRVKNADTISLLTMNTNPNEIKEFNKTSNTMASEEMNSYFPMYEIDSFCKDKFSYCNSNPNLEICKYQTEGMELRQYSHSFKYQGQLDSYQIKKAFFFDLPLNKVYDSVGLSNLSKIISKCWLDKKSRMFSISFNVYKPQNDINTIISITIYIEMDKNNLLGVSTSIAMFQPFINWQKFILDKKTFGFFKALKNSISTYSSEYIYLFVLFFFALISIIIEIRRYRHEKAILIYEGLIKWIFTILVDLWIFSVLIIRIICMIIEQSIIKEFTEIKFKDYFPTEYFSGGIFGFLSFMETIMIILILINLLNVLYTELYLRIFLTVKFALRYLFAFLITLVLVMFGYALAFNLLFGPYVEKFSTIGLSFTTMICFPFIDYNIMKSLMDRYSLVATVLIISYFILVYLIFFNLVFVFLYFAHQKVISSTTLTLLKFRLLWGGVKNFFKNAILRFAKLFGLRRKLTILFEGFKKKNKEK